MKLTKYAGQGQDPNNPYGYQRDPADPNNPQEGERGFMGAVAGGLGGGFLGHKANHGIIGTLAGAFLGSKAEDAFKDRKHDNGSQYGGGYGGSQYGGSSHGHHHHGKREGEW